MRIQVALLALVILTLTTCQATLCRIGCEEFEEGACAENFGFRAGESINQFDEWDRQDQILFSVTGPYTSSAEESICNSDVYGDDYRCLYLKSSNAELRECIPLLRRGAGRNYDDYWPDYDDSPGSSIYAHACSWDWCNGLEALAAPLLLALCALLF